MDEESTVVSYNDENPIVSESFAVSDDGSANWVVRKIIEARAYARHVTDWCQEEQARAQRQEKFFLHRYGEQLKAWALERIKRDGGRRKSVNLPAGMVGFRRVGAKLIVDDEVAVIAWAKIHQPSLLKVVEHLSKSDLNDHVAQTGEIPDVGVRVEPERESFFIK